MFIETIEHVFDLSSAYDWDAAFRFLKYNCSKHGHEAVLCHEDWSSACNNATYGFPCLACGWIDHDINTQEDMTHDELCCGHATCSETNGIGLCVTHGTYPEPEATL